MDAFPMFAVAAIAVLGILAAIAGYESRDGFERSHDR